VIECGQCDPCGICLPTLTTKFKSPATQKSCHPHITCRRSIRSCNGNTHETQDPPHLTFCRLSRNQVPAVSIERKWHTLVAYPCGVSWKGPSPTRGILPKSIISPLVISSFFNRFQLLVRSSVAPVRSVGT
jgi:hypothetical protein